MHSILYKKNVTVEYLFTSLLVDFYKNKKINDISNVLSLMYGFIFPTNFVFVISKKNETQFSLERRIMYIKNQGKRYSHWKETKYIVLY